MRAGPPRASRSREERARDLFVLAVGLGLFAYLYFAVATLIGNVVLDPLRRLAAAWGLTVSHRVFLGLTFSAPAGLYALLLLWGAVDDRRALRERKAREPRPPAYVGRSIDS